MVDSHEEVSQIFSQVAKVMKKQPGDFKAYVTTLTSHCITTEKAFRSVSNQDLSTMGLPLDVIKAARKCIGQEFYWNSRDQRPRLYTNAYNEGHRREQRYASLD